MIIVNSIDSGNELQFVLKRVSSRCTASFTVRIVCKDRMAIWYLRDGFCLAFLVKTSYIIGQIRLKLHCRLTRERNTSSTKYTWLRIMIYLGTSGETSLKLIYSIQKLAMVLILRSNVCQKVRITK